MTTIDTAATWTVARHRRREDFGWLRVADVVAHRLLRAIGGTARAALAVAESLLLAAAVAVGVKLVGVAVLALIGWGR